MCYGWRVEFTYHYSHNCHKYGVTGRDRSAHKRVGFPGAASIRMLYVGQGVS
jgi:hypothetical protein